MATHSSALKRHRQSLKRAARNRTRKSQVKTVIKKTRSADANAGKDALLAAFKEAIRTIDKAKAKGTLHAKTASRKIARLAKWVNAQSLV